MLLQKVLRSGEETVESLEARFSIKAKKHGKYPNLILFKYDQIESPMGAPIVQECRGVILDSADNWNVVARPFDKFFNYGEGHAAQIDWASAKVQEKVDGSLIVMYWYDGAWQIATSGTPDASGEVNGFGITFAKLFWDTWTKAGYLLPSCQDIAYIFELSGPMNRVVVDHKETRLTFLAMRNKNGAYEKIYTKERFPPAVKTFPLQTVKQIEATFATMNPFQQEGYVVVDKDSNRVKVKHPGYVAAHHMKDGFGPRRILEVVRTGESSEFILHFPEFEEQFNKTLGRYNGLVKELEEKYDAIKGIKEQKMFALEAVKTPLSAPLFQLRNGKIKRVSECLAAMNIDNLMEVLKLKE